MSLKPLRMHCFTKAREKPQHTSFKKSSIVVAALLFLEFSFFERVFHSFDDFTCLEIEMNSSGRIEYQIGCQFDLSLTALINHPIRLILAPLLKIYFRVPLELPDPASLSIRSSSSRSTSESSSDISSRINIKVKPSFRMIFFLSGSWESCKSI